MSNKEHENVALNLNEELRLFVRNRLREFAYEYPQSKFNILCWLDDVGIDLVAEFNDYLVYEDCPDRLKKGGEIIGKNRSTFYRMTKKEIL